MSHDLLARHPQIVVAPETPLIKAIEALTRSEMGIVLVAGKGRRLLGVLTDIDIRRALLKHEKMDAPVERAMTPKPVTLPADATPEQTAQLFSRTNKAYIPIVDGKGRLAGLAAMSDYATITNRFPNWVVVMAGGMGKRLHPLTENTPKPLVRVGDKPILELLLEQFIASGFHRFILAVNHLAEQIQDYCGDGRKWNVEVRYVHERKPLGTAGALGLIKRDLGGTFLVANGDILTKVDFASLLRFHHDEKALATLCIKQHEVQVPYGVIELGGHKLARIVEKPTHRYFVNAGIYAMEPEALRWLPKGRHCHMTDLLQSIQSKHQGSVACFPLQEYWLDVGRPQDHQRASDDLRAQNEGS